MSAAELRALVVDDEPLARRRLLRMLDRIDGVTAAGEAVDGPDALEKIRELSPDVVLLDIRMPGLDGLTLARTVPDLPPVVFTTAFDEYAVEAFEASAADYLLKPVTEERLRKALDKVRGRPAADPAALSELMDRLLQRESGALRVSARDGDTVHLFDAAEITRFHAADKYTEFRHGGREFLLDESLSSLERRLQAAGFLRVHRGELVNLNRVRTLRTEDGSVELELDDGQRVPVSRRQTAELKRRLGIQSAG